MTTKMKLSLIGVLFFVIAPLGANPFAKYVMRPVDAIAQVFPGENKDVVRHWALGFGAISPAVRHALFTNPEDPVLLVLSRSVVGAIVWPLILGQFLSYNRTTTQRFHMSNTTKLKAVMWLYFWTNILDFKDLPTKHPRSLEEFKLFMRRTLCAISLQTAFIAALPRD